MITVLGVDPGDTAGFLLAGWAMPHMKRTADIARAFQCDGGSAVLLLEYLLEPVTRAGERVTAVQIEAFDDRPKARGLRGTSPAAIRVQVDDLRAACESRGVPVAIRRAAEVKPWAADERLRRAGLLACVSPAAMKHAKSAGWHALYRAVHDCGLPDPLSRRITAAEAGREARDVPG